MSVVKPEPRQLLKSITTARNYMQPAQSAGKKRASKSRLVSLVEKVAGVLVVNQRATKSCEKTKLIKLSFNTQMKNHNKAGPLIFLDWLDRIFLAQKNTKDTGTIIANCNDTCTCWK